MTLAQQAGALRLEAQLLGNLSDIYAKRRRPADALRAADAALPTVRAFNDLRAERVLINNAGLAKIGLNRIAEGKQDFARVMAMWQRSGATADQLTSLREFGDGLVAAGDARGALELFHRERALAAEVLTLNRNASLKEMQTRYDAEAKQRSIDLLNRDNAVKTAALANRDLLQRIWLAAAAVMALSALLVVMLYRRVRETQRQLEASHAKLRVQSERDPLTNLANRRHFHAVMQASQQAVAGLSGALLLVDIDHFKHINDGHGHAAGDRSTVSRSLKCAAHSRAVTPSARAAFTSTPAFNSARTAALSWSATAVANRRSGPAAAAKLTTEQTDQLAARVLASIGATPFLVDGHSLRVTTSVGYARFPLPPYAVPVPWEQAVNLADMALYTAKSHGRNRAVGLVAASAGDAQSLHAIEADFDRSWHEGRVTLRQTPGP